MTRLERVTLSDAVTDFFLAKQYTQQSRVWMQESLRRFTTWVGKQGVADVTGFTPRVLRQYIRSLQETTTRYGTPMASKTVHGHFLGMSSFIRFWIREYKLDRDLMDNVKAPRPDEKVLQTFTPDQIEDMFAACEHKNRPELEARDRAMLAVMFDTAIRATELAELTLDRVVIRPEESYIIVLGKGRKEREVGLGMRARRELHRYISRYREAESTERHVFITEKHRPMCKAALQSFFKRLKRKAGIEGVRCSPHTVRHTSATLYLAQDGSDVYKLKMRLGHQKVSTTERYLSSYKSQDARKGISVLDELTRRNRT